MRKFELYNSTKTYMFPNGQLASPEAVAQRYPATAVFAHAVETDADSEVLFALENLSALRSRLGIDPALSAQDAIDEINVIANDIERVIPVTLQLYMLQNKGGFPHSFLPQNP